MTLRLIREAHIKASLTGEERQLMETVKAVLGKDSLASLMENKYVPSADDFAAWLDVIVGFAKDNNMPLNRENFEEIAGQVLENDGASQDDQGRPRPPLPFSMHEAAIDQLWLNYKSRRPAAKLAQLSQAAEDEERVSQAARTMVGYSTEDEEFEDQLDGTTPEESMDDAEIRDNRPSSEGEGGGEDEIPWWDAEDDTDQAAFPKFAEREYGGSDEPLDTTPEEDTFDPGAEGDDFPEDDMGDDEPFETEPRLRGRREDPTFENEEVAPPPKKMSVLQHMLTLPKGAVNTLVKDIESEGGAAWKQHQLPQNPHPKDSMAFKAWERGMHKAMKEQLGLNKEPVTKPAKKKTTRR